MEIYLIVIGIVIFGLIAYLIYIDQTILRKVVTYKRSDKKLKISDERYYELNNKIQLLITCASIIVLVGAFLGVNELATLRKERSEDIESYKSQLSQYEITIKEYNILIAKYDSVMKVKTDTLNRIIDEIKDIEKTLIQLQSDYSFNVRTYMVANIPIPKNIIESPKDERKRVKVYFKNLKTTEGEKLPPFKKPPFINIQNLGFAFTIMITEIAQEYFEYEYGQIMLGDLEGGADKPLFPIPITKFDILITIQR
jgi:hypothetical protein